MDLKDALEATGQTFESTAHGLVLSNVIITLVLSMSLKQMWNLLNVLQVLVFLRTMSQWTPVVSLVLSYLHETITLERILGFALDYGMTEFDLTMDASDSKVKFL